MKNLQIQYLMGSMSDRSEEIGFILKFLVGQLFNEALWEILDYEME